ncbi:MAG: hypothetical protein GX979_10355 [Firmicutes bacterium]|nr:hypothetical protein [Bacillota bacterium]
MREIWNRLTQRQQKIFSWLAVALIVGVGMLLLQPTSPGGVAITPSSETLGVVRTPSSNKDALEQELTRILNSMLGGNRTSVFLTMERGPSLKIAYNVTEEERWGEEGRSEKRWTSNPVLMRNDSERKEVPLVLEEIEPIVRGVLVVVDQQPSADVRLAVSQAVATALHVPMYRIEVLFKQ